MGDKFQHGVKWQEEELWLKGRAPVALWRALPSAVFGTCTPQKLAPHLQSGHRVSLADGLEQNLARKQFVHQVLNIRGLDSHLRVL